MQVKKTRRRRADWVKYRIDRRVDQQVTSNAYQHFLPNRKWLISRLRAELLDNLQSGPSLVGGLFSDLKPFFEGKIDFY